MSATRNLLMLLGLAVCGGSVLAQTPAGNGLQLDPDQPLLPRVEDPDAPPAVGRGTGTNLPPGAVASPWIAYPRSGALGPFGKHGPVEYEIFLRNGVSMMTGGGIFNSLTQAGWFVEAGGRSLFFNAPGDAAWTASLGVNHIYNNGGGHPVNLYLVDVRSDPNNPLSPPTAVNQQLSVRGLYRTGFNMMLGREWWLYSPAFLPACGGANWRFGSEIGGRWGTSHVDLNLLSENGNPTPGGYIRKQDVFGAFTLAAHTDIEVPIGSWIWLFGFRAEWDYTWMDIIKGYDCDIQNVNLLFTTGIRF